MKYEPIISGNYYLIYNRGNNREDIFIEEKNYDYFLMLMQRHLLEVAEILAYCLLKNHFHLVIKAKDKFEDRIISQKFSNFFNAYSKAINKAYHRTGSLFQDRFARKKIESEEYLRSVIIYVHTNPTHHNFVEDYTRYQHSSYSHILSNESNILDIEDVLELFDDKQNFIDVHQMNIELKNQYLALE